MSLAGLGHFAGGLAGGIERGVELSRNIKRQKREDEEFERQQAARRAASNTLGNVGQQREDGSTYDYDAALADYSAQVAPHDPDRAMNAHVQGQQLKASKVQLKGLERQERYAQNAEDTTALMRRLQNAPDEVFFPEVAKFASRYGDDGKAFGVEHDPNEGWRVTMIDSNSGQVFRQGIRDRQDVIDQLMSYASPQAFERSQDLGLKRRQVAATEGQLALAQDKLGLEREELAARRPVYAAQANAYNALGRQRDATGTSKLPMDEQIYLRNITARVTSLNNAMAKVDPSTPEGQMQLKGIRRQLRESRAEEFDMLQRHGLLPKGVSRTQYLQDPDPMEAAKRVMIATGGKANNFPAFRELLEDFERTYAGAPEAAEAYNALKTFEQKQFYGKVHPDHDAIQSQALGITVGPALRPLVQDPPSWLHNPENEVDRQMREQSRRGGLRMGPGFGY